MVDSQKRLGYRIVNPNDPPHVPRRMEAIDPDFQRDAERILRDLSRKWRDEDSLALSTL